MTTKIKTEKIKSMIRNARRRALKCGLVFEITEEDIFIPDFCPLLGTKLKFDNTRVQDDSPSLDRIKPELGYTKKNVWVISAKANNIKSNAGWEDIAMVSINLKKKIEQLNQENVQEIHHP